MSETLVTTEYDEKRHKYRYWMVTVQQLDSEIPSVAQIVKLFQEVTLNYWFQEEIGDEEEKLHYQCLIEFPIRKRKGTILNEFERKGYKAAHFTILPCRDIEAAKSYCTAEIKRKEGAQFYTSDYVYTRSDIAILDVEENRFPWQSKFMKELFNESETSMNNPDDRKIYWIKDPIGNSGKSKFIKWLYDKYPKIIKISFGSATQLRSSICNAGAQKLYFIDIPRTLGDDDSLESLVSTLEDVKNGFVVSNMYGKMSTLIMEPPHIVVFSNMSHPDSMMSADRWEIRNISPIKDFL